MAESKNQRTPWLEWAVGGAGAIMFAGILIVLGAAALRAGDEPPSISARIDAIERVEHGYVVKFMAINKGDLTAAQVRLEAHLTAPGGIQEKKEVTFDYLPPHSEIGGGFVFEQDPRKGRLAIVADGYVDP